MKTKKINNENNAAIKKHKRDNQQGINRNDKISITKEENTWRTQIRNRTRNKTKNRKTRKQSCQCRFSFTTNLLTQRTQNVRKSSQHMCVIVLSSTRFYFYVCFCCVLRLCCCCSCVLFCFVLF